MSIFNLFTASLLMTAVSITTAADAMSGGGLPPRAPSAGRELRLAVEEDTRSVGTASSARSCETPKSIKNYTLPKISASTTVPDLIRYYRELSEEYHKLKQYLSRTNQQMRVFLEAQGSVLREVDGLITDTNERRLRRTVEEGIAGLVRLYTELQTTHEALQRTSEEDAARIATLESDVRRLEGEKETLEGAVRTLTRVAEESRALAGSDMRTPLLEDRREKPKSDSCCSVQ